MFPSFFIFLGACFSVLFFFFFSCVACFIFIFYFYFLLFPFNAQKAPGAHSSLCAFKNHQEPHPVLSLLLSLWVPSSQHPAFQQLPPCKILPCLPRERKNKPMGWFKHSTSGVILTLLSISSSPALGVAAFPCNQKGEELPLLCSKERPKSPSWVFLPSAKQLPKSRGFPSSTFCPAERGNH